MGQCPMSAEPYHGDDEDRTAMTSEAGSNSSATFLVDHSFDENDRSMLDRDAILDSLSYQASVHRKLRFEKMVLAQSRNHEEDDVKGEKGEVRPPAGNRKEMAISESHSSELFSNAPTEATRKMSNVDRSAPKKKFRDRARANQKRGRVKSMGRMEGIDEGVAAGEINARRRDSFGSDESLVEDDLVESEAGVGRNQGVIQQYEGKYQSHINSDVQSKAGNNSGETKRSNKIQTQYLAPLSPSACLSGVYGRIRHGHEGFPPTKVLDLQWTSNFLGSYQKEYRRQLKNQSHRNRTEKPPKPNRFDKRHYSNAQRQISYCVDGSSFQGLSLTGSLGFQDYHQSPTKYEKDYLVLRSTASDTPLAVCALKSPFESPVVRIYASKPCAQGQIPAASSSDICVAGSDVDLFPWAEVCMEGEFPFPVRYSVFLSKGQEGKYGKEPSYKGSHPMPGSPDVNIVGRTKKEVDYRGCCVLSVVVDENNESDCILRMSLSRGMDPAIFICVAAIIDEIAMRKQEKKKKSSGRRRY